jgi:hypothetical protein
VRISGASATSSATGSNAACKLSLINVSHKVELNSTYNGHGTPRKITQRNNKHRKYDGYKVRKLSCFLGAELLSLWMHSLYMYSSVVANITQACAIAHQHAHNYRAQRSSTRAIAVHDSICPESVCVCCVNYGEHLNVCEPKSSVPLFDCNLRYCTAALL